MLDALILSARSLPEVSQSAAAEYYEKLEVMREQVDRQLTATPALELLIGANPLIIMYDNHRNHAQFMANVFRFNTLALLARIAVWVYKTYRTHGFSYDYFPVELTAWQRAVTEHLSTKSAREVNRVYQWLLDQHEVLIALSQQNLKITLTLDEHRKPDRERFLALLLQGDWQESLQMGRQMIHTSKDLEEFYRQIIQPCLYQVGDLWERNEISVAQEHLASAIVTRLMAAVYPMVVPVQPDKGLALVTAAPNEFHEMGARMLADCLELDGWEVDYLGANIPQEGLLDFMSSSRPFLACISITMPFNLDKATEIINAIKNQPSLQKVRILVGGWLFHDFPDLWQLTGADGWAPDSKSAVALAQQWWLERQVNNG